MIPLSAHGKPYRIDAAVVGKIVQDGERSWPKRIRMIREWDENAAFSAVQAVICAGAVPNDALLRSPVPVVHSVNIDHLSEGDVVRLDQKGHVRTLYRRASRFNALFSTDRCSSLCLMCSQPPIDVNDDWRVQEMLDVIELIDPTTPELGITGGEPTLHKDGFLNVVRACKDRLPNTALHVLSNGRLFRYGEFARRLAEIQHPDLMIGIPVYSDLDVRHDHVVQAKGAFDETLIGLQNLGRFGVPVEVRVVIHSLTYERLPQLAEFIYRNLTFASHIALMGMEMMGFAISNLDLLWIDPYQYREQIEKATLFLAARGMNVSIYNHQLCTIPETIWPYCRKSISDWKNEYLPQCESCDERGACGGFFASAIRRRHSQHIQPLSKGLICGAA